MAQHFFDDLSKALADEGLTRRGALWQIGGSLAGGLLVAVGLRKSWAQPPPTTCAGFCRSLGLTPGRGNAYGQCVSNCANCKDAGGTPCGANDCCVGDEVCNPDTGICEEPGAVVCTERGCPAPLCGPPGSEESCFCGQTAEGGFACVDSATASCDNPTCTSTADCPSGQICIVNTCCGSGIGFCDNPCGTTSTVSPFGSRGGPTQSGR